MKKKKKNLRTHHEHTYVVVFADTWDYAEGRVRASRHRFDSLSKARDFADEYDNAYIFRDDLVYGPKPVSTRQEMRLSRKRKEAQSNE